MYHDKLNIKFWDEGGLRPEVREKLMQIGVKWADFAKIPSTAVKDVILVGGNANYNYTRFSDLIFIWLLIRVRLLTVQNS